MSANSETGDRELDRRSAHGIDVALLWNPHTRLLFVAVEDEHESDSFRIQVDAADALDAFRHPYVYARRDAYAVAA